MLQVTRVPLSDNEQKENRGDKQDPIGGSRQRRISSVSSAASTQDEDVAEIETFEALDDLVSRRSSSAVPHVDEVVVAGTSRPGASGPKRSVFEQLKWDELEGAHPPPAEDEMESRASTPPAEIAQLDIGEVDELASRKSSVATEVEGALTTSGEVLPTDLSTSGMQKKKSTYSSLKWGDLDEDKVGGAVVQPAGNPSQLLARQPSLVGQRAVQRRSSSLSLLTEADWSEKC